MKQKCTVRNDNDILHYTTIVNFCKTLRSNLVIFHFISANVSRIRNKHESEILRIN